MILRLIHFQVVEYRNHHRRSCVLRAEPVTTANDNRIVFPFVENITDIKVQRISCCAWFLGTIKNTNTFY